MTLGHYNTQASPVWGQLGPSTHLPPDSFGALVEFSLGALIVGDTTSSPNEDNILSTSRIHEIIHLFCETHAECLLSGGRW